MLTLLSAEAAREERKHIRQARIPARKRADVRKNVISLHFVERAVLWLAPWRLHFYPGRLRIIGEVFGKTTRPHVWRWRHGLTPLPSWAARAMADAISLRCAAGMEIVGELRRHAEEMDSKPRQPGAHLRGNSRLRGLGRRGQQCVAGVSSAKE